MNYNKSFRNGVPEYSDLQANMKKSWDDDVQVVKGAEAVKQAILGIITTRKGTRPFNPDFGCNITDELFENMGILTEQNFKTAIIEAIRNYEPRVDKIAVRVKSVPDENAVDVMIVFSIISAKKYYENTINLRMRPTHV